MSWDYEAFTKALIEDMRAHGGRVTQGPMAGRPLLLLTTTGARSGEPRTAILTYTRDGDAYVVAGSASGAPKDPAWLFNVKANPRVTVEADGRVFQADARIAEGEDHDRLWDAHVAARPEFAEYPEKAGRVIPMVRLVPAGEREAAGTAA